MFWGISPNPLLANILGNIKRKILRFLEPNTVENILPNKTIFTKDSDYNFCDNFLAYGISKVLKNLNLH